MASTFPGPVPPSPPLGRSRIVEPDGTATMEFAQWLARLLYFLAGHDTIRVQDNYDPPPLGPNGAAPAVALSVPGAKTGDECVITFSETVGGLIVDAWVSAPDVVTFQFINPTTSSIDLPPGIVRIRVRTL